MFIKTQNPSIEPNHLFSFFLEVLDSLLMGTWLFALHNPSWVEKEKTRYLNFPVAFFAFIYLIQFVMVHVDFQWIVCLRQNILTWNITLLTCRRALFIYCPEYNGYQWVAVFSHCSQFLVQFYANFTWMFMTICCHKRFRISVDRNYCAMENKTI